MTATPLSIAPRVQRWHAPYGLVGAPLGISRVASTDATIEPGDAVWIAPHGLVDRASPSALLRWLPEPVQGALVFVAPDESVGLFTRLFRSRVPLTRAVRGSALLLRGYHAIGGGIDPISGLDLAWGQAPR